MKITHGLFELTTGKPLSIPVRAPGRWTLALSQRGSGTHDIVIPYGITAFTPEQWAASTMKWWHVLVEMWDGQPKYAGIIVDKHWSPSRQTLTLDTLTIDTLLEDRYPFGVGSYETTTFGVAGVSLRGAVAQTINRVFSDPFPQPYTSWLAPLDIAFLGEAGGFARAFPNEDWRTAKQIIETIQKLPGGPDVVFRPKLTAEGWLRWDVVIGDPLVTGPTIDLPLSVRSTAAADVVMHEYGRDMFSGLFVRGEGLDKRRGYGEAGNAPGPFMAVRDVAQNEVGEELDLTAIAGERLRKNRGPVEQNEVGLLYLGDGPGRISPASVLIGARVKHRYSGDGYKAPFDKTAYMTSISFDGSRPDTVRPELQVI